jgi:uncharacterized repeat protein (TIGR03803 family)
MKSLTLNRYALSVCAAAVSLAACGPSQNSVPSATSRGSNLYRSVDMSMLGEHGRLNPAIQSLHVFTGPPDGSIPYAGLTSVYGVPWGTTAFGGTTGTGCSSIGCGVIFAETNGVEGVVYRFQGGSDGFQPMGDLIFANDAFYGTTYGGGNDGCNTGCGTIFEFGRRRQGQKDWTYKFQGGTDGATPEAGLVYVNGTLYGTTVFGGGTCGCGTIFAATANGLEKVIWRFQGSPSGANPYARLINVNGVFYGTTAYGGRHGRGTVFTFTTNGSETLLRVLHSFAGGTDGANPFAGLVYINGTLYGTTSVQGAQGYGTIFALELSSGTERVIYSFKGGTDGANPYADLIDVNGTLYGTTRFGGGSPCSGMGSGCGTVYSVTPSGAEKVIYAFQGGDDGEAPEAHLLYINPKLFGTTIAGGAALHDGNVFSLKL